MGPRKMGRNPKPSRRPAPSAARPGEFELIARYFAPLAAGAKGAAGLQDDVAEVVLRAGEKLIVKTDAVVEGRHYLPSDEADLVARKLLRVNLSDLAGKGARPVGYVIAAAFPDEVSESWIADFARGLAQDQSLFRIPLLGGDTTATPGPATFAVTAFGAVSGRIARRRDAKPGDDIWVSGTLGDGALGLLVARGKLPGLDPALGRRLEERYRLPEPRLAFGRAVIPFVRASMDISDGLIADLEHICDASSVGAKIEAAALPLSDAAASALAEDPDLFAEVLGGGDDYEILFTAAPARARAVEAVAKKCGVRVSRIGKIRRGNGIEVVDRLGRPLEVERKGYRHF